MSGGKRNRRETIAAFVDKAHAALDDTDYYAILGVGRDANIEQLKTSYYKLASQLHPDLHGDWMTAEQRHKLTAVYSRVVEAYKVLAHGERRAQYNNDMAEGRVRLDADAAAHQKIRRPEDEVPDGAARKFFKLGCDALHATNGSAAVMNLRMALSMAPGNEVIKTELDKAEKLAESQGDAS